MIDRSNIGRKPQTKSGEAATAVELDSAFDAMGRDVDDTTPSTDRALDEEEAFEEYNEKQRQIRIKNDSDLQDMGERKRYADKAYGVTQAWVGFLIVVTISQMALKPYGMNLETPEFITFVTTTTASVFGFWILVGNYLFRKQK